MRAQLQLSDKISITIVLLGVFCMSLMYYISESYKQFAYEHHLQSIQQLARLEVDDLLEELQENSLDLALAISKEDSFKRSFRNRDRQALKQQLDNQFYQYFVTAGIIRLLKLYILDTDFTLISISGEGIDTGRDSELICPQLSQRAMQRKGPEMLQILSQRCLYRSLPVFAVIVPFGGLRPAGYIQVITDLSYSLKALEQSLAIPVQIQLLDGQISYQSDNWVLEHDDSHLIIRLPITDNSNRTIMTVLLQSDMTGFNREANGHRNRVMGIATIATVLMVLLVIMLLQRTAITPLAKIHDLLSKMDARLPEGEDGNRLLFEQLLEQIILLKKDPPQFAVIMLELKHFRKIRREYGGHTGEKLLDQVRDRLAGILRGSDFITWIGTGSFEQKQPPVDAGTRYRAGIARLGGDEFGLLLPSAQTVEQAVNVARRIISSFDEPFTVDGRLLSIGCHIGISLYPQHGDNAKTLVRNAGKAMHRARELQQDIAVFESVFGPVNRP